MMMTMMITRKYNALEVAPIALAAAHRDVSAGYYLFTVLIMAALFNRAGHYIFVLWFLLLLSSIYLLSFLA